MIIKKDCCQGARMSRFGVFGSFTVEDLKYAILGVSSYDEVWLAVSEYRCQDGKYSNAGSVIGAVGGMLQRNGAVEELEWLTRAATSVYSGAYHPKASCMAGGTTSASLTDQINYWKSQGQSDAEAILRATKAGQTGQTGTTPSKTNPSKSGSGMGGGALLAGLGLAGLLAWKMFGKKKG